MRRALVFLLLFGLGFATLVAVQTWQRRRLERAAEERQQAVPAPVPRPRVSPPFPLPDPPLPPEAEPATGHEQGGVTAVVRSRFSTREFDKASGATLFEITAENSAPVANGAYDFEQLVALRFSPDTGTLSWEVAADQARARVKENGSFDPLYPITLHTVEATLHEGPRFIPLRMYVPVLEGLLATQRFTSRERARIEGNGLLAVGLGIVLDGIDGSLLLVSDARVELTLAGGGKAVLTSVGGLLVRSPEGEATGPAQIVALGDAHLVLEGDKSIDLRGRTIRILGDVRADDPTRFIARTVIAEGDVRIVPERGSFAADGTFSGQLAELRLSEAGVALWATLEQEPEVEMLLRDVSGVLPGEPRLPETGLPARISGAGPLRLDFSGTPSFDFVGPAQLEIPSLDAVLTAEEDLHGEREGESASILIATGSAVARSGAVELTSEVISSRAESDAAGGTSVRLAGAGPTIASGATESGGDFALTAAGGLEYLYSGAAELVTEARDVELLVRGPDALFARAQRVVDFDPRAFSFVAEGDVEFVNADGTGTADRVDAHSRTHAELTGSPSRQARYEMTSGGLAAAWIEYRQSTVRARGSVAAHWSSGGQAYAFQSHWLELERLPLEGGPETGAEAERFELKAGGSVHGELSETDSSFELQSDLLEASGLLLGSREQAALEPSSMTATGNVRFDYFSSAPDRRADFSGTGERLETDGHGQGRLTGTPAGTVSLSGDLPTEGLAYSMVARQIEFSPERVIALDTQVDIEGALVRLSPMAQKRETRAPLRAVAGKMVADTGSVLFSDSVYLGQLEDDGIGWYLDSDKALLLGGEDVLAADERNLPIHELLAWGGFRANFNGNMDAEGLKLRVDRRTDLVQIEGAPAQITTGQLKWTSAWFEWHVDSSVLKSGQGRLESLPGVEQPWSLTYESLQPLAGPDATIQVVREPNAVSGDQRLRASWALFWVDSQKWASFSTAFLEGGTPTKSPRSRGPRATGANNLFALLDASRVGEWLNEAYLEGNVEVLALRPGPTGEDKRWERISRAEAAYIDLIDGHAWIRDVSTSGSMDVGSRKVRLKLRADWLRHSADGSFQADRAVVTSCDFESPHYEIRIGDLRMDRRPDPRAEEIAARRREQGLEDPDRPMNTTNGWNVSTTSTGIAFNEQVSLPLPPIEFPLTDGFEVPRREVRVFGIQPLSFGTDARFGAFVRAKFVRPLGRASKTIARGIDKAMGLPPQVPTGSWEFEPTYLGSRGFGLNVDNRLESDDRYEIRSDLGLMSDRGIDKGLVRVPTGDRDNLRLWYHLRGRFLLDPEEWVDLVVTKQSDPGVQSEFYESQYLRFEERESYVHWRKADQLEYWHATAELELDGHRTEVEEQPSFGYYRGRGQVGTLWGAPVNYTSDFDLERLNRVEGDPQYEAPFADGFGERDVLRFDTTHRVERPTPLGVLGMIATPFIEARGTVWDGGVDGGSAPSRAALSAGAEVGTSFWRQFSGGARHDLSPAIGVHGDLVHELAGSTPAVFDHVESPLDGRFVDLRLRSRLSLPSRAAGYRRFLDVELTETHASDVASGEPGGWLPVRVNAAYLDSIFGIPIGATHEARYDLEAGTTPYSRTFFGIDPLPQLEIETGYHSGQRDDGELLYSAFSTAARYTISEKWQVEGRQTISITSNSPLSSAITVRRFGHDFVFELGLSFRAGEGGNSLTFDLTPLLLWSRPPIGLLDRWTAVED